MVDIDYNNLRNRFQTLTSSMNKQSNISLMKNFEYSPAIGEFVAAKCNKNTWQRAKIISVNKDSVEVFYNNFEFKYIQIAIINFGCSDFF